MGTCEHLLLNPSRGVCSSHLRLYFLYAFWTVSYFLILYSLVERSIHDPGKILFVVRTYVDWDVNEIFCASLLVLVVKLHHLSFAVCRLD